MGFFFFFLVWAERSVAQKSERQRISAEKITSEEGEVRTSFVVGAEKASGLKA